MKSGAVKLYLGSQAFDVRHGAPCLRVYCEAYVLFPHLCHRSRAVYLCATSSRCVAQVYCLLRAAAHDTRKWTPRAFHRPRLQTRQQASLRLWVALRIALSLSLKWRACCGSGKLRERLARPPRPRHSDHVIMIMRHDKCMYDDIIQTHTS